MTTLHPEVLEYQIESGLLSRWVWSRKAEDGRMCLCAYTALFDDAEARPENCPSELMPIWFAELIWWMGGNGTIKSWFPSMRRLASVAHKFQTFTESQWHSASVKIRVGIVRETMPLITKDQWGVRAACEKVIAALESGDKEAAEKAEGEAWAVRDLTEWGPEMWVAKVAAMAADMEVTEMAAAAGGDVRERASQDRIISMILDVIEALASLSEPVSPPRE